MPEPRPLVAIDRESGSVSEICASGEASLSCSIAFKRCSSLASLASFSLRCAVLVASASDGPCRSAVSSWLRYHALLDLLQPALHLRTREILVARVHRLELAAVNRHARARQQTKLSAKRNEPRTYLADRRAVILAEVSNRLVIGNQSTGEPHHLNVAPTLTLEPTARLNAIEIAVDVQLQQDRGMVGRPSGCLRINATATELRQIEILDKYVDCANRIIFANPILQAFREQRTLPSIRAFNEPLHLSPPQIAEE